MTFQGRSIYASQLSDERIQSRLRRVPSGMQRQTQPKDHFECLTTLQPRTAAQRRCTPVTCLDTDLGFALMIPQQPERLSRQPALIILQSLSRS